MPCLGPKCSGCPQQNIGQSYVPPDGLGTSGLMVLAESPWIEEVKAGKPLVGASGHTFNKLLRRAGIERDSLLITNSMNCKAPNLGWFDTRKADAAAALEACKPYLLESLERVKPKVVVTLGGVALNVMTGFSNVTKNHAYVLDSFFGVPVIPTFHPSYIQRGNHKLSGAVVFALKKAASGNHQSEWGRYLLDPDMATLESYVAGWDEKLLAFDIETTYSINVDEDEFEEDSVSSIIRVSFATRLGEGVSVPWAEPYITFCRRLIGRAQRTIFWNQAFDVPRLRAAGVEFKGVICDAMWMWHFLQSDLPKSLGFVAPFYTNLPPWKHLSDSEPAFYSAVDADATFRLYAGIKGDLEAQGRWGAFERHCTRTLPLLGEMGHKGLLINVERQREFKERLEAELSEAHAKLQTLVPNSVKPFKIYKRPPSDMTNVVEEEILCEHCCGKDLLLG